MDAVFGDLDVGAVKIGMVAQLATIDAIAAGLARWSPKHVVLDPVMVATSGDRLLAADAVERLRTKLIPRAALITPNLPEAAALLDEPVAADEAAIEDQGRRLLALGCDAVLIKAGTAGAESIDYLVTGRGTLALSRRALRPQYPWNGMLAVFRHRRRACQRRGPGDGRAPGQGWISAAIAAADRFSVGHGHGRSIIFTGSTKM